MWVKVCGIRDRETALRTAEFGADAIGLNFYARSPRRIELDEAIEISRSLPRHVARVGLFVNHATDDIESITDQCQLDIIQLHGDEPAEFMVDLQRRLPRLKFIRAWRMDHEGLAKLQHYLGQCDPSSVVGCLIDAHVPGTYGGTGQTVPWQRLVDEYQKYSLPPLILAGGLVPDNVLAAIEEVKPWGVDVASGVESSSGVKDLDLIQRFITNARQFNDETRSLKKGV